MTASNSSGSASAASAASAVVSQPVGGASVYVAQTSAGSGNGSSCANAESVATLNANAHSEWTAGNTIGLCGTITSNITAQGSGTAGNPITLDWEPGAVMSMSAASCLSGCVNLSNRSYVTLNGGSNGVIQATNNGDQLALDDNAEGVQVHSTDHVTIKDLTIQNMYVKHQNTQVNGTGDAVDDVNSTNLVIDHNTFTQDGGAGVYAYNTAAAVSNITISNNDLSEENWTITLAGGANDTIGPVYIYGNHIHDLANWDDPNDSNHHNGIHCYTGGSGYAPHYNGFYVYNNLFNGDPGAHATSWFFVENCSDDATNYYTFNNIFASTNEDPANGDMAVEKGNDPTYDNTFVGATGGGWLVYTAYSGDHDLRNNIVYNGMIGEATRSGCGGTPPSGYSCPTYSPAPSHNLYANSDGGGAAFVCPGGSEYNWSSGWSNWVSCLGGSNSFGPPGSSETVTNPGLDSNYDPTSGSPALGAGQNLYSTCNGQPNPGLGALCSSYGGPTPSGPGAGPNGSWVTPTARPSSAAWTVGAY